MKLQFSRQIYGKYSNIKFHENPSSGSRDVPRWWTDRETDTKLVVALRNFANEPKNELCYRGSFTFDCSKTPTQSFGLENSRAFFVSSLLQIKQVSLDARQKRLVLALPRNTKVRLGPLFQITGITVHVSIVSCISLLGLHTSILDYIVIPTH